MPSFRLYRSHLLSSVVERYDSIGLNQLSTCSIRSKAKVTRVNDSWLLTKLRMRIGKRRCALFQTRDNPRDMLETESYSETEPSYLIQFLSPWHSLHMMSFR